MEKYRESVAILFFGINEDSFLLLTDDEKEIVFKFIEKIEKDENKNIQELKEFKFYKNLGGSSKESLANGFMLILKDEVELTNFAFRLRDIFRYTNWKKEIDLNELKNYLIGIESNWGKNDKVENGKLKIKIGMHYGEIYGGYKVDNKNLNDVYAQEVDFTARIKPITLPNEIFCSDNFYRVLNSDKNRIQKLKMLGVNLDYLQLKKGYRVENVWRLIKKEEKKKFNIELEILEEDDVVISTYKIDKDLLFIGRGEEKKLDKYSNKINLLNVKYGETLSRVHAKIEIMGKIKKETETINDVITISDMGSLNGTFIDNRRVSIKKLFLVKSEYFLKLGKVKLKLKIEKES